MRPIPYASSVLFSCVLVSTARLYSHDYKRKIYKGFVIQPSAEGSPASTPGASDMLQRMQAYRRHPAQQA